MNSVSSKIIVAGGLAAVVGIGVVWFALSSHNPPPVAQIAQHPAAVPTTPEAPAAVAPMPQATAAVAHKDSVGAKIDHTAVATAVEPKVAHNRHPAKAPVSADATHGTAARTESPVDSSEKPAGENLAKSADGVKSVDQPTTPATRSERIASSPRPRRPARI